LAAGAGYGCFDLSKQASNLILSRKGKPSSMSYASSVLSFGSTIMLRNMFSPHDFSVVELIKKNEMKKLMGNSGRLILFQASSLFGAGAISGLVYSYFSE
jgi:hypothetical protein